MNKTMMTLIGIAFAAISQSTLAFNEDFLTYSPISYFTKEDTTLFVSAKNQALNSAKDGQKISWSNPTSGSHGYFIPSNTTTNNGMTCRQLTINSVAHKVPGQSSYHVCKINGVWKVV